MEAVCHFAERMESARLSVSQNVCRNAAICPLPACQKVCRCTCGCKKTGLADAGCFGRGRGSCGSNAKSPFVVDSLRQIQRRGHFILLNCFTGIFRKALTREPFGGKIEIRELAFHLRWSLRKQISQTTMARGALDSLRSLVTLFFSIMGEIIWPK